MSKATVKLLRGYLKLFDKLQREPSVENAVRFSKYQSKVVEAVEQEGSK